MDQTTEHKIRNFGPFFALIIVGTWTCVHLYSLFVHELKAPIWQTFGLIALQCWLYTGMFIIAHDTMHDSLFKNPHMNARVGTAIMFIYAGFNWRFMRKAHHQHHSTPGTDTDPDFNAANPAAFWPWYMKFFLQYFGLRQVLTLFIFTIAYILLGAPYLNTIIMWAAPAILSSVQLFYFGTYLTHRHKDPFPDEHNARTNDFPLWLSLISCFHFGYHHEHHLHPHEPWWRLPTRKRQTLQGRT
ncbi:MAG: fatty acid desaturase [Litorimonas sp.]